MLLKIGLYSSIRHACTSTRGVYIFCLSSVILVSCDNAETEKARKILITHPTVISNLIPDYYSKLFKQEVQEKIKSRITYQHIGRDTVCDVLYDGKFYLALYRLNLFPDISLKNALHENSHENTAENGIPFYENGIGLIYIKHRIMITDSDKTSNIFMSFGGSGLEIIKKTDDIADYFFRCKSLSITYAVNAHQAFFAKKSDESQQGVPLEVMFLKQKRELFLIFITAKDDSAPLTTSVGYTLLK